MIVHIHVRLDVSVCETVDRPLLQDRERVIRSVRSAVEEALRSQENDGFTHELEDRLSLHVEEVTARGLRGP